MSQSLSRPLTLSTKRRFFTASIPRLNSSSQSKPFNPSTSHSGGGIPILPTLALAALVGGGYYYYSNAGPAPPAPYGHQASQYASNASHSARDAGHALVDGQGRQAADYASNAFGQATSSVDARMEQAKQYIAGEKGQAESQSKKWWNDAKNDAASSLKHVQHEAQSAVDHLKGQGEDWKQAMTAKKDHVEGEARGWFSWGKSQVKDGESRVRDEMIWAQREAAKNVQRAGNKISDKAAEYK